MHMYIIIYVHVHVHVNVHVHVHVHVHVNVHVARFGQITMCTLQDKTDKIHIYRKKSDPIMTISYFANTCT